MWNERLCKNTGDVMSVSAESMNSLRATIALQAERLDSLQHSVDIRHASLPRRRSGALLSNHRCHTTAGSPGVPITTAGHPDVTCARCDGCVITLEAMSVA